jgi:hypothetical protein
MYNGCRNVCNELCDGTGLKSIIVIIFVIFIFYMKYLITESKLNQVIFKYLDNQDFIQIDKDNSIYFVYSEDDEYAQIIFDKDDGWCIINYELINELSSFFSLDDFDSEQVIGRWVENTLQMRVTNTFMPKQIPSSLLRIPSK